MIDVLGQPNDVSKICLFNELLFHYYNDISQKTVEKVMNL